MCHGYRHELTAPAIVSYSTEESLDFYDGNKRKDSIWILHRNIQLSRDEWESIARQMQPGDMKM